MLVFEIGDQFHKSPFYSEALRPRELERARLFVRVANRIGLSGATFGELDFALGPDVFRELASRMKYPLFAGNVVDEKSGQPLFQGSKVITIDGYRIGLMGIVSADFMYGENAVSHKGMKILPPAEYAKAESRKLKKQCDFIIALAHLNKDELKETATQADPLSFILAGHNTNLFTKEVRELSKTPIFQLQNRGRELGLLRIRLAADDFKFDNRSESANIRNRIRFYEQTVERFQREMQGQTPEDYYKNQPSGLKRYKGYLKRLKKDRRALLRLAKPGSYYEYETIKLNKEMDEDMQVNGWTTKFVETYPSGK